QNLRQMARPWTKLSHVNVAPILGTFHAAPHPPGLVLPCYEGNACMYAKHATMSDILQLLKDASAGVAYLHSRGIVHGDIRGTNVLVDDSGRVVISDYGLKHLLVSYEFRSPSVAGHVRWQAPEVFADVRDRRLPQGRMSDPFDKRSDVYSFGMLGVELVTGDRPFSDRRVDAVVVLDILKGRRPKKPSSTPLVDAVWSIFEECWNHDSDARPGMSHVRDRLACVHF
ncbi:hypothetical protein PLICRDRAFT_112658, partial [Plicaturopsis crispa FD-325 SS-3]